MFLKIAILWNFALPLIYILGPITSRKTFEACDIPTTYYA